MEIFFKKSATFIFILCCLISYNHFQNNSDKQNIQ